MSSLEPTENILRGLKSIEEYYPTKCFQTSLDYYFRSSNNTLVFDGELEIIEIKTENAKMTRNQKNGYLEALSQGYKIRHFRVDTDSFNKNRFHIIESVIKI